MAKSKSNTKTNNHTSTNKNYTWCGLYYVQFYQMVSPRTCCSTELDKKSETLSM